MLTKNLKSMNQHLRKKMLIAAFLDLNYKKANQKINAIFNKRILNILICTMLTIVVTTGHLSAATNNMENTVPVPAQPETEVIKGRVVDETGETLVGVNIKEKGTANITVTDNDGKFTLKVKSKNPVLIASYIGYTAQEIEVGNSSSLEITLKNESKNMDEVVVIGYQTVTRRDVQGAVSSIQMKDVKGITSPSVDAMLQGMIPGLNIQINSGQPGGRNTFNIRGNTSTAAGETSIPLFVLDGVPVDPDVVGYSTTGTNFLTNINPTDIESIDVLRDAASASIYGSRAANGVVLIKTKKGLSGKPKISFNQRFAAATIPILPKVFTGTSERAMRLKMLAVGSTSARASKMPIILTDSLNPAFNNNTDWYGLFYRPATTQDYNLSISGGTDAMNYRTSVGYYIQNGTLKGTGFNRFSFTNNLVNRIGKRLTFNTNIALTLGSTQAPLGNAVNDAVNTGNPMPSSLLYLNDADKGRYLGNYTSLRNDNSDMSVRLSELVTFKITDWLMFNSTSAYSLNNSNLDRFSPASISGIAKSEGSSTSDKNVTSNFENYFNFNKTFNNHRISAVVGTAFSQKKFYRTYAYGAYFSTDLVQTVSGSPQQYKDGFSDFSESALLGAFSRVQYFYKDRYSLYASIRSDGSSKLSSSHRYGTFPSFGAFWTISEEPFMKNIANTISFFKLRSSYGRSGNQPGGNDYGYNSRYMVGSSYGGASTIVPNFWEGAAQKDLSWETTKEIDLGLDLELLKGRFFFSADWYNKDIDGLFFRLAMPVTSGYDNYNTNSVGVRNRGYELMLKANVLPATLKDWSWSVTATASHNNNMITALPNGNKTIVDGARVLTVGHPINQFNLAIYDGVYATDDEVPFNPFTGQKYKSEAGTVYKAGDAKLRDIDGNYQWFSYMDKTAAGNPNPKWIGGLFSSLTWKNLTLDLRCSFTLGRDIYNQTLERSLTSMVSGATGDLGTTFSVLKDYISSRMLVDVSGLNYWQKPGDKADYPSLSPYRNVANFPANTTMYLENGSYFKMNSIMLSYRIPNLKKYSIDNLRLSLTTENLFVIKAKSCLVADPENVGADGIYTGNGYGLSRLFTFGLQLEF
jgi:TonB-dependent starch-binding outer membrane protein SusC